MPRRPRFAAWGKSLYSSLSLSLFLWLFGVIIVAFGAYAMVSIHTTSLQWNRTVRESAERFSDLIRRSTYHDMLLNQREHVIRIIETIAGEPGVVHVRIYDKHGVIMVSDDDREIGRQVDLRAEACIVCHEGGRPLREVRADDRVRIWSDSDHGKILGLINAIPNEPTCSEASCHAHSADQTVLGVLDVQMSFEDASARLAASKRELIVAGLLIALLTGGASTIFILHTVARPVRRLIDGVGSVAAGDLDTRIPVDRANELGRLAEAFNSMAADLGRAREELRGWSERLEQKLVEKSEELTRTQRHVTHMEKMASLGKLAATVAHELNNPLAGILTYARLAERTVEEGGLREAEHDDLARSLGLIRREAGRCGDIVRNLLLFARRSGTELALHSINEVVDRALMLVRHHLEMANVALDNRSLDGDDGVVCDADQVQQALVALLVNAVEAMPDGGTLTVSATSVGEAVELVVADTGVGIPPDVLPRLFEPFFSTKDKTSGVGLGLAVVYGIVRRHGGEIDVDSEPGRGTAFRVRLPRHPPRDASASGGAAGEEQPHEPIRS